MQLRKLLPADWEWIQQWFQDGVLNDGLSLEDEIYSLGLTISAQTGCLFNLSDPDGHL